MRTSITGFCEKMLQPRTKRTKVDLVVEVLFRCQSAPQTLPVSPRQGFLRELLLGNDKKKYVRLHLPAYILSETKFFFFFKFKD